MTRGPRSARIWTHGLLRRGQGLGRFTAGVALLALAAACGDDEDVCHAPSMFCESCGFFRRVVAEGSQQLPPGEVVQATFDGHSRDFLAEAEVDWTLPSSQVEVLIAPQSCDVQPLLEGTCPALVRDASSRKPKVLSIRNPGDGRLLLLIINRGFELESVSYRVVAGADCS